MQVDPVYSYVTDRKLQQGGQGGCWLVRHRVDNHLAVMKGFFPNGGQEHLTEIETLLRLGERPAHQNILRMFWFHKDPISGSILGVPQTLKCLCFYDYYPGGDLHEQLPHYPGSVRHNENFILQ